MTKKEKELLLRFCTRIGMYIQPQDQHTIVSFITGYEIGTNFKSDFIPLLKDYIAKKYSIECRATGWPGQIDRLSEKLSLTWVITFKKILLETVANEGLSNKLEQIITSRIENLIEHIYETENAWFNTNWREEWISLCASKSKWFKQMWSTNEFKIIKTMDAEIQANRLFLKPNSNLPAAFLLSLKEQFTQLKNK
jgi:hypothetical protein